MREDKRSISESRFFPRQNGRKIGLRDVVRTRLSPRFFTEQLQCCGRRLSLQHAVDAKGERERERD